MTEIWFARTWIIVAALFIAALDVLAIYVFAAGAVHWKRSLSAHEKGGFVGHIPDFNSTVVISSVVVAILNVIVLGAMNVGQAFLMATEGAEPLAWLVGAVLFPLVAGKTITKFSSNKYGSTDVPTPPNGGGQ